MIGNLTKPYTFVVGESYRGTLTQTIRTLPHLMIAGTTYGGKSIFFKQVLLGMLRSSSNLQLYLLDLKRGVEVSEFKSLPNVKIAKDEMESVSLLYGIRDEMTKRFIYLEQKGFNALITGLDLLSSGVCNTVVIGWLDGPNKLLNFFEKEDDQRRGAIFFVLSTKENNQYKKIYLKEGLPYFTSGKKIKSVLDLME